MLEKYDYAPQRKRDLEQLLILSDRFETRAQMLVDFTLDPPSSTADLPSVEADSNNSRMPPAKKSMKHPCSQHDPFGQGTRVACCLCHERCQRHDSFSSIGRDPRGLRRRTPPAVRRSHTRRRSLVCDLPQSQSRRMEQLLVAQRWPQRTAEQQCRQALRHQQEHNLPLDIMTVAASAVGERLRRPAICGLEHSMRPLHREALRSASLAIRSND